MKTLVLRQVRQLAQPALVSVGLGALTFLGMSLTDGWRQLTFSPADIALALVTLVAPWLIAVAAIAPDAESGGLAFLGGLPLGPTRHFALRALVALGWSIAAVVPFVVLAAPNRPDPLLFTLSFGALAFIAGLAAGAVVRQSLAAFVTAPLLVAAPLTLYALFTSAIGAPAQFQVAAPFVLAPVLVVAGWVAFREPAGRSWRPVLRTTGLLLGAVALACGATTAAWAHAVAFPTRHTQWSTDGPVLVRIDTMTADWNKEWSRTTTFFPASDLDGAKHLEDLQDGWTFDGHLSVLETTPAGRVTAYAGDSDTMFLLDVSGRKVLARERRHWNAPAVDRSTAQALPDDTPWFVTYDGAVRTFGGKWLRDLPDGATLEATGGARLVARLPDASRVLVDLRTGAETALGPSRDYVILSPRGRYLAQWTFGRVMADLTFRHLDDGREVALPVRAGAGPLQGLSAAFSPDERAVIVTWSTLPGAGEDDLGTAYPSESRTAVLDLERGTSVEIPSNVGWILAWSPGGRRVLTYQGWIDLDDQPTLVRPLPELDGSVRRFVDEDTILWSVGGELTRIELGR